MIKGHSNLHGLLSSGPLSSMCTNLGGVEGGFGVVLILMTGVMMSSSDPEPTDVHSSSSSVGHPLPSPEYGTSWIISSVIPCLGVVCCKISWRYGHTRSHKVTQGTQGHARLHKGTQGHTRSYKLTQGHKVIQCPKRHTRSYKVKFVFNIGSE